MSAIPLAEDRAARKGGQTYQNQSARVLVLPVAPLLVARTRFSPPPPPRNQCLPVPEALELLSSHRESTTGLSLVALSGPGDPLATPENTLQLIRQCKALFPELPIALRSYGFGSRKLAAELAKAGLETIDIQVDALRAEVLEKLYAWIRPGQKTLKIAEAARLLIEEQRHGVPALVFNGLSVRIRTTLYPGHNLDHVKAISREMQELGAEAISLIPYSAKQGVEVELEPPDERTIADITATVSRYLPVKPPLFEAVATEQSSPGQRNAISMHPRPSADRPNVAVVSSNGMDIDLHLGQASRFLIYGPRADGLACLLEAREAPRPGLGGKRWESVAELLKDCFVLVAASAGEAPREVFARRGLKVLISDEPIEGTVDVLYGGGKKGKKK